MPKKYQPTLLIILDGWGLSIPSKGNAIAKARTPNFNNLWEHYPKTTLQASGEAVGLPHGLMGNSEVGHINLGAGRVVKQDLTIINESIEDGTFFQNPVLLSAIQHARANGSNLHLMGLLSDGGVHSDIHHLYALLKLISESSYNKEVYIHGFTDGQDTAHKSAKKYLEDLEKKIKKYKTGRLASLAGRYYAMDRAHNWERNKMVYDMLVHGKASKARSPYEVVEQAYAQGKTDEFIEPTIILNDHQPIAKIKDRDVIIFFNLRSDRARQLTKPFVLYDFDLFDRGNYLGDLFFVGMTNFGDDLPMSIAFPDYRVKNSLPEFLGNFKSLKQLYIAEEEKFAHVAYFFHGGSSVAIPNEERIMIASPEVKSYASVPPMSAGEVTKVITENITRARLHDFILVNYANPDMLGHTGNFRAVVEGVEYVDGCLGKLLKALDVVGGRAVVTADHGNAERMLDPETGEADTKHTTNPVPFIIYDKRVKNKKLKEGLLGNVAPSVLGLMNIDKPEEMTEASIL